jgi:hypothetical protein
MDADATGRSDGPASKARLTTVEVVKRDEPEHRARPAFGVVE